MTKHLLLFLVGFSLADQFATAADAPPKPPLKIAPGKVIIPAEMRRPWGELISLDPVTRTGKFRREDNDEVASFTILPYAALKHHAAYGDLQDFRVSERLIFRLHENEAGEWVWLSYIQDEMNMMNFHKEYFHVDSVDAGKGQIVCTQGSLDKSYVRQEGIVIETGPDTRYWKAGEPAKFADIKVGDTLRTQTHGVGKGAVRVAWEVFLDDESLLKFQTRQGAVNVARLKEQGIPGYVDEVNGPSVSLTLFDEALEQNKELKAGQMVSVAPAGVDRNPTATAVSATISSAKMAGRLCKVTLTLTSIGIVFEPTKLARLWTVDK